MLISGPLVSSRPGSRSRVLHSPGVPPVWLPVLVDYASRARSVSRHTPPGSPSRADADYFDGLILALLNRGVPVEEIARLTSVSHQAVRRRAERVFAEADLTSRYGHIASPAPLGRFVLIDRSTSRLRRLEIRRYRHSVPGEKTPGPVLMTPEETDSWLQERRPMSVCVSGFLLQQIVGIDHETLSESR